MFTRSATSDKDTMENLLPTIIGLEGGQSPKPLAGNKPSKSSRSVVSGDLSERLAKRQKDKLDRAAVNDKSRATCVRGTDSLKPKRLVDQLHSALVNARDSWLPAQRKVTVLSTAEAAAATELEKPNH
ncbi:hypothetical protein HOY80DRAFT_952792, partial [Tuber brumale]